jgi:hypothetical protein
MVYCAVDDMNSIRRDGKRLYDPSLGVSALRYNDRCCSGRAIVRNSPPRALLSSKQSRKVPVHDVVQRHHYWPTSWRHVQRKRIVNQVNRSGQQRLDVTLTRQFSRQ